MSEKSKHLWVVMGPAGCGKTIVGKYLASQLESSEFIESDFVSTHHRALHTAIKSSTHSNFSGTASP
jgi:shikimate kinase